MTDDIKISPPAPGCARCAVPFPQGVTFTSAIREENDLYLREDVCDACWPQVQTVALCHWRARLPPPPDRPRTTVEEMREFFKALAARERTEHQARLFYLAALWLIRKKQLKLLRTRVADGPSVLQLSQVWDGRELDVVESPVPDAELPTLLEEFSKLFHIAPAEAKP